MIFRDRAEAGRLLAQALQQFANHPDVLVLALPRGGVPVGYEVARALNAPLDVFLVRKLGVPGQEELAMGAIASGGIQVLNEEVVHALGISGSEIDRAVAREQLELEQRERLYRGNRSPVNASGRTLILVDDGLATGSSMRAAALALRRQNPARIVVAIPVAAPATCASVSNDVDEVVCAITPEPFVAVGQWYQQFLPTTDEKVRELLERSAQQQRLHAA